MKDSRNMRTIVAGFAILHFSYLFIAFQPQRLK